MWRENLLDQIRLFLGFKTLSLRELILMFTLCLQRRERIGQTGGQRGQLYQCMGSKVVSPTVGKHKLIGHSKFSLGENVSVDDCLSLYISAVMNWQLVQGATRANIDYVAGEFLYDQQCTSLVLQHQTCQILFS